MKKNKLYRPASKFTPLPQNASPSSAESKRSVSIQPAPRFYLFLSFSPKSIRCLFSYLIVSIITTSNSNEFLPSQVAKKKAEEKKKSNLELFKEELKQ